MRILTMILKGIFSIIWLVLDLAIKLLGLLIQIIFSVTVLAFKLAFMAMNSVSY